MPSRGRVRKDVARRNDDLRAGARQPRIDAGIRRNDFFVADAVAPADVEQRVFVLARRPAGLRRARCPTRGGNG